MPTIIYMVLNINWTSKITKCEQYEELPTFRVLLEKLIVTQAVKVSAFYDTHVFTIVQLRNIGRSFVSVCKEF